MESGSEQLEREGACSVPPVEVEEAVPASGALTAAGPAGEVVPASGVPTAAGPVGVLAVEGATAAAPLPCSQPHSMSSAAVWVRRKPRNEVIGAGSAEGEGAGWGGRVSLGTIPLEQGRQWKGG